MNIVLFKTGWMNYYQGLSDNDEILKGGSYIIENGVGSEIFNFKTVNGKCYGNVYHGDHEINLAKIDSNFSQQRDNAAGVLVIWCATRPKGGIVVIGWYKNATVSADWLKFPKNQSEFEEQIRYGVTGYRVLDRSEDAFLLKPQYRDFLIPSPRNGGCGFGQSNIRYMDESDCDKLRSGLIEYIESFKRDDQRLFYLTNGKDGIGRGPASPEVEEKAIEFARRFYEKGGYTVNSVESLNLGWDMEAIKKGRTLRIEVKGLSGEQCSVGLTPNEYRAFRSENDDYRLFVVTSSMSDTPGYFICRKMDGRMIFEDGNKKYTCVTNEVKSAIVALGRKLD